MKKWIKPPNSLKTKMKAGKDCQHENLVDNYPREQLDLLKRKGESPYRCPECSKWIIHEKFKSKKGFCPPEKN